MFILQDVIHALIQRWELIVFIIVLIFNSGVMFSSIRNKPSEQRVQEIVEERFENHCPFTNRINDLEINSKTIVADKNKIIEGLQKENEFVHLSLQRVELNLKRVCDKLEIDYLQ